MAMITSKAALLEFMKARPTERLEYRLDRKTGRPWVWVRVPMSSSTTVVSKRAADGLVADGKLVRDGEAWRLHGDYL